jgi:hypothetical protein
MHFPQRAARVSARLTLVVGRDMKRAERVVFAMVCFGLIAAPLLFLFAQPGTFPSDGPLSRLYLSMVGVLGEQLARFIFCATWVSLDAALVWQFFFRQRGQDDGPPIEGLGD